LETTFKTSPTNYKQLDYTCYDKYHAPIYNFQFIKTDKKR